MSPCLSFSHPCLSSSLSVAVSLSSTPVSLPIFLSPTMPLFFCDSLSLSLSCSLFYPRLSLLPSYLSISLEPRSLFLSLALSLSLSRSYLYLSLQSLSLCLCRCLSVSLFLLHLYLRSVSLSLSLFLPHVYPRSLSLSLPLLSFFLSFSLIACLSFYLFSRSLSHPCLSLFFLTLISFSRSLSLSFSLNYNF